MIPDPPPQAYARNLLPLDHGYPLWTPEPGNQFLRYRREGLRIGDVGVILPENGSFDVFFNVCLPREHPFHHVNGVPDNFVHVDLDEMDIAVHPHAENSGRVISTSSVTTLRTTVPSGDQLQSALTYEFSLSSSEGALLILPEGAESHTLLKRKIFNDLAIRHGVEWYNFAEQQLGRMISHNSLYLITGCYKSHSWSVAAFHETSSRTGPTEFPAQFKPGQTRPRGNISAIYTWETTRAMHWRIGPLGDWTEIPNQAVFITGFKIAIKDNILGKRRIQVEVNSPPAHLKAKKYSSVSKGKSSVQKLWKSLLPKGGGNTEAGEHAEANSIHESGSGPVPCNTDGGGSVTVSHVPETLQSPHPSDIINRCLLSTDPVAVVAVTHDSQWNNLLEKGILKPEDLYHDGQLKSKIFDTYCPVSQDGAVRLQSISDSLIRLTDVEDSLREVWKNDRLDEAEELLSRRIIRRTSSDHSAFAHRALIRARLHHWDAALRDAETSIDIEPSVAAHVARGFALFGQQKYTPAVHTFNAALRDCGLHDKTLISLIKFVVLFEVGYHAESAAGIADLIEHCPADAKLACSATQAEVYVRLAALATENKDYDRALQLLTRAQSSEPFHPCSELEILLLICGWRVNNLQFRTSQQKCEVLYVAGRIGEAVESLRTMTHDLAEDVKMREGNASWIAAFTQKCLQSLESLGDSALASQNYTEAIIRYSDVLSMNPTTREQILVKRSNAHAAAGAWNDALTDANEAATLNPLSPWVHEKKFATLKAMGRRDEAIQAFNDMLSALERFTEQHTESRSLIGSGPQSHRYSPLRNLDHKSVIESVTTATRDVDFLHVASILAMLRAERDKMVQENSAGQFGQLEQQVGILNTADGAGSAGFNKEFHQTANYEQYQKLRDQLTGLVRQNLGDDKRAPEMMKTILKLAEHQLILSSQQGDTQTFEMLEKLYMHNSKQKELLDMLLGYRRRGETSGTWKEQGEDGGTDREPELPYSFQSVRDEFVRALATEAQTIVEEIARLGEERRRLQQDIGRFMVMQSKYGPGGEFDPDWMPPGPPPPAWASQKPQPPAAPPLPPKADSGAHGVARPGWHLVKPKIRQWPEKPAHLKVDTSKLLGPWTPSKTSMIYAEPDPERKPVPPERNLESNTMAEPPSPTETLLRRRGRAKPAVLAGQVSNPHLGRSSPKPNTSSPPSPLSETFPPLEASPSRIH